MASGLLCNSWSAKANDPRPTGRRSSQEGRPRTLFTFGARQRLPLWPPRRRFRRSTESFRSYPSPAQPPDRQPAERKPSARQAVRSARAHANPQLPITNCGRRDLVIDGEDHRLLLHLELPAVLLIGIRPFPVLDALRHGLGEIAGDRVHAGLDVHRLVGRRVDGRARLAARSRSERCAPSPVSAAGRFCVKMGALGQLSDFGSLKDFRSLGHQA